MNRLYFSEFKTYLRFLVFIYLPSICFISFIVYSIFYLAGRKISGLGPLTGGPELSWGGAINRPDRTGQRPIAALTSPSPIPFASHAMESPPRSPPCSDHLRQSPPPPPCAIDALHRGLPPCPRFLAESVLARPCPLRSRARVSAVGPFAVPAILRWFWCTRKTSRCCAAAVVWALPHHAVVVAHRRW